MAGMQGPSIDSANDAPLFFELPGYTVPDDLDLADNCEQGVFLDINYKVTRTWREYIGETGVSVPDQVRSDIVARALGQDTRIPQRDFVRRMIKAARGILPQEDIAALEEVSMRHGAPKECGVVALVIVLKEEAKQDMIDIVTVKDKEAKHGTQFVVRR